MESKLKKPRPLFVSPGCVHPLGDWMKDFMARIDDFQRLYRIGKYASRHIKATKCALSILGVCDDFMAEPFHHFKPPEREKVRHVLETDFADYFR